MALQESVFDNALQFAVETMQAQAHDDEREEVENDISGIELEEGEIEDDDEDAQKEEEKLNSKSSVTNANSDTAKEGSDAIPGNQCPITERIDTGSNTSDRTDKRRDKRPPASNVSTNESNNGSRGRKRTEEGPRSRDSNRKRRRTLESGRDEAEDFHFEAINARGHSPLNRPQRYGSSLGGDDPGSDEDALSSSRRQQRSSTEGRARMGRTLSPVRRRSRGTSREVGGGPDRRRQDRGDRLERERRLGKSNAPSHMPSKDPKSAKEESICAFYMEGKCSRGSDCPYSHAALPPRKMELCKFYLMDCCAKKEKCLYLHKDFPCKFFHTGKKCRFSAADCKFSHDVLSETMRAILIKHIETAPREILGDFPRLTREETIQAIEHHSPHPRVGRDKRPCIPALFESSSSNIVVTGQTNRDTVQSSEGCLQPPTVEEASETFANPKAGFYQDVTALVTSETGQNQERTSEENSRSIWFGKLRQETANNQTGMESHLSGITSSGSASGLGSSLDRYSPPLGQGEGSPRVDYLFTLPAKQRQLFRRIQQQQREPVMPQEGSSPTSERHQTAERWYSSDEDDGAKSVSDVFKTLRQKPDLQASNHDTSATSMLPNLNMTSLENINVAEIAKALSTLQQSHPSAIEANERVKKDPRIRDPRMRANTSSASPIGDIDLRIPSSHNHQSGQKDVDLRLATYDFDHRVPAGMHQSAGSSDTDLRLSFKPTSSTLPQPVAEIDASLDSHPPMEYRVWMVDYVPLDYSLIRTNADWAHLDPRQQRHFSVEGAARDFTSTEPPSIPLGPASPDSNFPATSTALGRDFDSSFGYSSFKQSNSDPRGRDPRRSATSIPTGVAVQQQSQPQFPEKRGLLGVAPPGVLPFLARKETFGATDFSSDNYGQVPSGTPPYLDRGYSDRDPPRPMENRRDPRQRLRNASSADQHEHSSTPPNNDRSFR